MPPLPSALADIPNGSVTSPRGFTAAAAHAGLKADGAPDVALLVGATSCATAGVFTKNALRAAPVVYDADLLAERPGRMRAVAMNARVANACTGAPGLAAARAMAQAAEQAAGLPPRTALVLSTGVIGVPLPLEQVADGLRAAAGRLTPEGGPEAARAIMTTDTRPKHCAVRFETPAGMVTVGGIAKGAGMIHPDMATLLAVLTTDAVGEPAGLQPLLRRVVDRSFNAISVDGDTSTNDTVLLLAAGASGVDPSRDGALWKTFEDAVLQVARTLALASGGATAHADLGAAHAIFQQKSIRLRVDLGLGRAEAVVWTCDLTPDYVRINADYTSYLRLHLARVYGRGLRRGLGSVLPRRRLLAAFLGRLRLGRISRRRLSLHPPA